MTTINLRDGDVTLYTRSGSATGCAGYNLPEGERLQQSLETRNKVEARARATARLDAMK